MTQDTLQFCISFKPNSTAVFSPCRRYRYELWRRWAKGPAVAFVCLNPSTADETQDDPTVRRCINYAKAWGFGAFCMLNLFAYRATDPAEMKRQADPIGPANDRAIFAVCNWVNLVVAAWGVHGTHQDRHRWAIKNLANLHHLGLTKDGHPRHPLYLQKDLKPHPMKP